MSTVDISRFAHGLPKMLAPAVQGGQTFYAFLEKENSFTVQADNILKQAAETPDLTDALASIQAQISSSTQKKVHFYIHFDCGTDEDGDIYSLIFELPFLNPDTFDIQKACAISEALKPCVCRTVYTYEYIDTVGVSHLIE